MEVAGTRSRQWVGNADAVAHGVQKKPPTVKTGAVQVPVPATPESPQRVANIERLDKDGFRVARSLQGKDIRQRPTREVAARPMALNAPFLPTILPGEDLPEATLQAYMDRNQLERTDALRARDLEDPSCRSGLAARRCHRVEAREYLGPGLGARVRQ